MNIEYGNINIELNMEILESASQSDNFFSRKTWFLSKIEQNDHFFLWNSKNA